MRAVRADASDCSLCLLLSLPARGPAGSRRWHQVHGNRRIPADTIKARIFTRIGDVYDLAAIERDFNSLWNTGYFEDIRFEREQTPKGWVLHILRQRTTHDPRNQLHRV